MGVQYGRLASFVFALCCILAVISIVNISFAATNTELMYGRMAGGNVTYKSAAQLRLEATYNHSFQKVPDQVARYVPKNKTFSVSYTQAQLRNMIKGVGKNTAVYATVAGAVVAAGWVIDELTGQITKTTQQPINLDPNFTRHETGFYYSASVLPPGGTQTVRVNAADSATAANNAVKQAYGENYRIRNPEFLSNENVRYRITTLTNTFAVGTVTSVKNICSSICPTLPTQETQEPISDADFDTQIKPKVLNLPNHQLETGLLRDTQGNPKITPQLDDSLRDWLQDIANRSPHLEFNPSTRTLTYTNPDTLEVTEIKTQPDHDPVTDPTESNSDIRGFEWPQFCDWATIVCDLAEFIMGEPDELTPQQVPYENINLANLEEDFNSGLGSGSCPAPISFSYGGYSGDYEFTTACFAAETYFRPVLLAMAAIMAGFIIVGATRKSI